MAEGGLGEDLVGHGLGDFTCYEVLCLAVHQVRQELGDLSMYSGLGD